MTKNVHVMVAFVSQLAKSPTNVEYQSVDGKEMFSCMQTNEAAVCQLQSLLQEEGGLAKIILIETDQARERVQRGTADWLALMEKYSSESMSAVELLKAQSVCKYSELSQVFEDSEYSKMGIEDSMRSIAGIAERVRAFAERVREEEPEAEVVLHADMTGGFRYAALMLLVVMQLSKYMGIRMGHVVYSDFVQGGESRVHLTDDIRRMFDLVAGADGVISNITAEEGQIIAAGQTVMTLTQEGEREIEIAVPESRLAEVSVGMPAAVALWANSAAYTGTLRELSPVPDAATRTYTARIALTDAPADLPLGMTARVRLGASVQDGAAIPLSALYQTGDTAQVYVVEDDAVHLVPVTVTAFRTNDALVTGLPQGARIVTAGVHQLHEGEKVRTK